MVGPKIDFVPSYFITLDLFSVYIFILEVKFVKREEVPTNILLSSSSQAFTFHKLERM